MTIDFDIERLKSLGLTIKQYLICVALRNKERSLIDYFMVYDQPSHADVDRLIQHQLLFIKNSNVTDFRNLVLNEDQFVKIFDVQTANSFIEKWFDLWPKGVMSGGYYVRTDIRSCESKMSKFMKRYPKYNEDIIMNATRNYLNRLKVDGFNYLMLAPNFIEKNNQSILAGECQNIVESKQIVVEEKQGDLFGTRQLQ